MMSLRGEKPTTSITAADVARANRRETTAFVFILIVSLIISIATTLTLTTIIYKLRLIPGFAFVDFAADGNVVFHKDAYIDRLQLARGRVSRLSTITGNVELRVGPEGDQDQDHYNDASLRLDESGIRVAARRGFEVRCPATGRRLFPPDLASVPLTTIKRLSVPGGVRDVKLIRSPVDEDLLVRAKERIRIRGNRGVAFEGKHINMRAGSIFLASLNGSITLDGREGVFLDMKSFAGRIAAPSSSSSSNSSSSLSASGVSGNPSADSSGSSSLKVPQFQLCVCAKNGRLFRVPVKDQTSSCADARFPQSENPCTD